MSVIRFGATAKGNLPHLSYIFRKPDPLGGYFKIVACYVTGALLFIEVKRVREGINNSKYHLQLGETAACTKRMMEATKGIVFRDIKGATKDCFIFESWFSSKKLAEAVMDVGADLIGMDKTNIKGFCREIIEKLTKDWPGCSYLLLRSKPMVPRGRPLIAIGYKYNGWKVLSFIVTDNTGSTKAGDPYLSKYPDQFSNVAIRPVARPLVMYKFFGYVNLVESHNKSRQYDLALETFWATQYGWLRLCTTVAMGMAITNCWKLFRYGVKRDHYGKLVGIREFSERLALNCFNNPFSTDTGTTAKNIPPLD